MKIKRHKKFQRNVKFFMKHFEWKPPFHLLIDGTFAKAALDNKVNLRDQLPKYFDHPIRLYTSPCALLETEGIGPELYGALQVMKSFQLHKCPHAQAPLPAANCIRALAAMSHPLHPARSQGQGDKKESVEEDPGKAKTPEGTEAMFRFIPATQDHALRKQLRHVAGVPLLHLNGPAPSFERPSRTSVEVAAEKGVKKLEVLGYQKEILNKMKKEVFGDGSSSGEKKGTRKRKRAGPNPLSCKKGKKKKKGTTPGGGGSGGPLGSQNDADISQNISGEGGGKKRRKRVRIAKHVREEMSRGKSRPQNKVIITPPS